VPATEELEAQVTRGASQGDRLVSRRQTFARERGAGDGVATRRQGGGEDASVTDGAGGGDAFVGQRQPAFVLSEELQGDRQAGEDDGLQRMRRGKHSDGFLEPAHLAVVEQTHLEAVEARAERQGGEGDGLVVAGLASDGSGLLEGIAGGWGVAAAEPCLADAEPRLDQAT
jgi:hypothetical protein